MTLAFFRLCVLYLSLCCYNHLRLSMCLSSVDLHVYVFMSMCSCLCVARRLSVWSATGYAQAMDMESRAMGCPCVRVMTTGYLCGVYRLVKVICIIFMLFILCTGCPCRPHRVSIYVDSTDSPYGVVLMG